MKKILLMWMMVLGVTVFAVAQDDADEGQAGGRVEALKIAWITKKLDLTPEEGQKFWPIYNQYSKEIRKTRTDAKANNTDQLKIEEQMLNIRKKYETEFQKALTKEKVNKFFRIEREFLDGLRKQMIERRQNLNRKRNN
jgi:hypothetical protein